MTEWLLVGLAVVLIWANAMFVAAEFSLVTIDRGLVERRSEAGDARAGSVLRALRALSTQLSGAQLGITVTSLVVGFIAEPSVAALLRGPLGEVGLEESAARATAFSLAFALATGAQMVFGELVPKNWAIAEPLRVGRAVAGFQRGFTVLATPLLWGLNGSANAIVRALGIEPREELASARTPGELASLATRSASQGTLEQGTAELVARSIEFGERRAADVMTPRPRVHFVSAGDTAADVLSLAAETGVARFPVTGEDVDEVTGVVHFKHALAVPRADRATTSVEEVQQELPAVPETMDLDALLGVVRRSGPQMAVVVDEYGGTAGIVTLEDLVEEIVGEIQDEQDRPLRRARQLSESAWTLSGLLRPDEAEDITGLLVSEPEESDTLAGLVTELLGRLPEDGDTVTVQATTTEELDEDGIPGTARVELTVTGLDGWRVDRLRMRRLPEDEERDGEQGAGDE